MCLNANDKFTVDSANENGMLTNPVGLITLDEVVLAGFNTKYSNTSNYKDATNYLYTNKGYWSLSPVEMGYYGVAYARVGGVFSDGYVDANSVGYASNGVRPVISLKSGTTATGSGTTTDPYVVK